LDKLYPKPPIEVWLCARPSFMRGILDFRMLIVD
jgi:hypothetical protein